MVDYRDRPTQTPKPDWAERIALAVLLLSIGYLIVRAFIPALFL